MILENVLNLFNAIFNSCEDLSEFPALAIRNRLSKHRLFCIQFYKCKFNTFNIHYYLLIKLMYQTNIMKRTPLCGFKYVQVKYL